MKPAAIVQLTEINRSFYSLHGRAFSDTRLKLQPGVRRIIESFKGHETVLDLGCGNGVLAAELSRRGHRGPYLGVDLSASLLGEARARSYGFAVQFLQADVLQVKRNEPTTRTSSLDARGAGVNAIRDAADRPWSVIAAFAVLHHIPSWENRLALLSSAREWLDPAGKFFLSVWQFAGSPRFRSRIQPWSTVGLRAEDLDHDDFLLDWRGGSPGLRYVHQFSEAELAELAAAAGFTIAESFHSDGKDRHSGLYQVWRRG
jgi:tRNA (uracil-5-)-methyltransferase TRM9